MASLVTVSVAASLALHAMTLVSRSSSPLQSKGMSETLDASGAHLSKVLLRLVRAGLLHAKRGPGGGFELARPAREISLKEIYEAVEGQVDTSVCPLGMRACDGCDCPLGATFMKAGTQLVEFMARTSLHDYQEKCCIGLPPVR